MRKRLLSQEEIRKLKSLIPVVKTLTRRLCNETLSRYFSSEMKKVVPESYFIGKEDIGWLKEVEIKTFLRGHTLKHFTRCEVFIIEGRKTIYHGYVLKTSSGNFLVDD